MAEAKASEQRAEQLHASAEQKEQASVAQSLSVNRERLQLATETRDITQLRQEAEQQAAEVSRTVFLHPVGNKRARTVSLQAKARSQKLEEDIAKLKRQLVRTTLRLPCLQP